MDPASIGRNLALPTQGQAGVISGSRRVDNLAGVHSYHCIHQLNRVEDTVMYKVPTTLRRLLAKYASCTLEQLQG